MIGILEQWTGIPDASAVYLVVVVIVGSVAGTTAALGTAVVAFLVYDILFTEPRLSLVVADPSELLNLILVLIVAIAVGRLAALGRERAAEADRRAIEATGQFAVSRLLATAETTEAVAGAIVERLARDARLDRVWIGLAGGQHERILADTGTGPVTGGSIVTTLVRTPGDQPARWVRAHGGPGRGPATARTASDGDVVRIRIETGGTEFGSLWAMKAGGSGAAGRGGDPIALAGGRPDRARPPPRPPAPGCDDRRGGPPQRCPQERPARLGVARPADAAGEHPRDGREPGRSGGRLVDRTASVAPPTRSIRRPSALTGWSARSST